MANRLTQKFIIENFSAAPVDLDVRSGSLWATNETAERGVYLGDDCPAVVIENENGKLTTVEYANVERAVKHLDKEGEDFDGQLYVFLEDGYATSVIFVDNVTVTPITPGVNKSITILDNDAENNFQDPVYTVADGSTASLSDGDIYKMLEDAGCKNISKLGARWNFVDSNGIQRYLQTINATGGQVWKLYIDNQLVAYTNGTGVYDVKTMTSGLTLKMDTAKASGGYKGAGTGVWIVNDTDFASGAYYAYSTLTNSWSPSYGSDTTVTTGYVDGMSISVPVLAPYWSVTYKVNGTTVASLPTQMKIGDQVQVVITALTDMPASSGVGINANNTSAKITCTDNTCVADIDNGELDFANGSTVHTGTVITVTYPSVTATTTYNVTTSVTDKG